IANFEGKYRPVLGTMIFVNTMNIAQQRDSPDKQQKQNDADRAIHQVENDLLTENRIDALQFRRSEQRQEFVHEDEEAHRNNDIDCRDPAADLELFLAGFLLRIPDLNFI